MSTVSITGNDTILINDRVLRDLADGDAGNLTFPNDLTSMKIGKNGNSIININEMGKMAQLVLRVIKGSSDDKFLNGVLANYKLDPVSFTTMTGEVNKRIGDGSGNVSGEIYTLRTGVFLKEVETRTNVEGDTESSVSIYTMQFAAAPRTIG